MSKIRQTQLYNIITDDKIQMLTEFFGSTDDFSYHHELSVGKRYKLLEQAIVSKAEKCSEFLMRQMDFNDLVDKYHKFLIEHFFSNIFVKFIEIFTDYVEKTKDMNVINKFIICLLNSKNCVYFDNTYELLDMWYNNILDTDNKEFYKNMLFELICKESCHIVYFTNFIDLSDEMLLELLNDADFKNNLENLLTCRSTHFINVIIELYQSNHIDLTSLYTRILTRNDNYLKKNYKYFKNINLNDKVYLTNTIGNIYSYEPGYFSNKNYWVSKKQYSLIFLIVIKGKFDKKKHSKLELFKSNNLEIELTNLIEENHWEAFIWQDKFNGFKHCIFYGMLYTNSKTSKGIDIDFSYSSGYLLNYFLAEYDSDKNEIENKLVELKPYFTNYFYDKMTEINEAGFANCNGSYEYFLQIHLEEKKNSTNNYPKYTKINAIGTAEKFMNKMREIYQANKDHIERLRNL